MRSIEIGNLIINFGKKSELNHSIVTVQAELTKKEIAQKILDERRAAGELANLGLWSQICPDVFPCLAENELDGLLRLRLGGLLSARDHWVYLRGQFPEISDGIGRAQSALQPQINIIGRYLMRKYPNEYSNGQRFLPTNDERNALGMVESLGFYELINAKRFPSLSSLPDDEVARMQLRAINNRINDIESQTDFLGQATGFTNGISSELLTKRKTMLEWLNNERERIASIVLTIAPSSSSQG